MAWYNPLSWGKKRTEADIQKARLLERAITSIDSGTYLIREMGTNFLTESVFTVTLGEAKKSLDDTKDSKYIGAIDELIKKWDNLKKKAKSLKPEDILRETEAIERELGILRGTIAQEIRNL
ncbi:hypothetical protein HYX06_01120 [Candidatus Woesearchaeota archaeon]|nr:hypothetical protein [Candidatus Woesearchaeota archaeon]